jgi:hypothetical protein
VEVSRDELARFFEVVLPHLNEVQRRVVAGAMAEALGHGGKTAVAESSGMSRNTVIKAEREVSDGIEPSPRQRALGGGDIKSEVKQPGLLEALDELVHPETRGNPMSFMRWTSKSSSKLAEDLVRQGFKITDDTVGRILKKELGYSLQTPPSSSSPPMLGARTAIGSNSGRSSWASWPQKPDSRSPSVTTHRGPRSGTRSSTACSASSL